jgi:hypothetical protein
MVDVANFREIVIGELRRTLSRRSSSQNLPSRHVGD